MSPPSILLRSYLTRLLPTGRYNCNGEWIWTSWEVHCGRGFGIELRFKNSHAAFAYCDWSDTYIRSLIKDADNGKT